MRSFFVLMDLEAGDLSKTTGGRDRKARQRVCLFVNQAVETFRSSLTYCLAQAAAARGTESLARRVTRSALVNFHSKGLAVDSQ